MLKRKELRIYVTDGANLWRIYSVWITLKKEDRSPDGSFYFAVPSKNEKFLDGKFTYHPKGTTHFKTNDGEPKYRKFGWANFQQLTICAIDSFGFKADGPLVDDPLFQELKRAKTKKPALLFDIRNITDEFILRMYLGKRDLLEDRKELANHVTPAPPGNKNTPHEELMDIQVHNFGEVETSFGSFDLSIAVALIQSREQQF